MSWADWRWSFAVVVLAGAVFGLATAQERDPADKGDVAKPGNDPPPKLTEAQSPPASVKIDQGIIARVASPRAAEALGGKDAVALTTADQIVDGRRDQTSTFDGQTYSFSSESNKAKFDENPAAFAPALSGLSVVAYKDGGKLTPGLVEFRSPYDGRVYLFANEEEKKAFDADPKSFEDVDIVLAGFSPVSLVDEEVLRRGDKEFEVIFEGRRVRLADAKEKETFLANPSMYFPTLGGIDPISVADGKPDFGLARFSVVYKNRLYSLANEENRNRFIENAEPHSDLDVADGGRDPVTLVDDRADRPGHYGISTVFRGQRYLFSTESNRDKFLQDPARYDRERSRVKMSRG